MAHLVKHVAHVIVVPVHAETARDFLNDPKIRFRLARQWHGLTADLHLHIHTAGAKETENVDPPVPAWGGRPWHSVQDSVIRFQSHVVDVLNGKTHPQPSGADNLNTLALTLASYDAMAEGRLIDIAQWRERQP